MLNTSGWQRFLPELGKAIASANETSQGLRDFADHIDKHPNFGARLSFAETPFTHIHINEISWGTRTELDAKEVMRQAYKDLSDGTTIDNPARREVTEYTYTDRQEMELIRDFGPICVYVSFRADEVCELVDTGETKTETVYDIPEDVQDQIAQLRDQHASEIEVPVMERRCEESVLRP